MSKFCYKCGKPLSEGTKFCPACGTPVAPIAPQPSTPAAPQQVPPQNPVQPPQPAQPQRPAAQQQPRQLPQRPAQQPVQPPQPPQEHYILPQGQYAPQQPYAKQPAPAKKKKAKGWLIALIAAVLVVSILIVTVGGFVWPGFFKPKKDDYEGYNVYVPEEGEEDYLEALSDEDFVLPSAEPAGASTLTFDKSAYKNPPEKASVDIDHPSADLPGGVKVSFGALCLDEEAQELGVVPLGKVSDADGYSAVGYDLTLNGESAEFCGLAKVTLPYESSWGDNVFVQYLNEETGAWEIKYAEPNGDGTVTFYTDHFCTFGVFKWMVNTGNGTNDGKLWEEIKTGNDLETKVAVNWGALAKTLRDGKLKTDARVKDLTSQSDAYFAERATTVLNNTITGVDFFSKAAKIPGVSKVLGPLGQAITVGKFLVEGHKNGWSKAINKNAADLIMMGVGMGSVIPGPVGWICAGISFGYYVYSAADAVSTDIKNGGQDSVAEYAYREFTKQYVTYNVKNGQIGTLYFRDWDELSNWTATHRNFFVKDGNRILQVSENSKKNTAWRQVFDNAKAIEQSGGMNASEYFDKVVTRYCNAFWSLQRTNPSEFQRFLMNTNAPAGGKLIDYWKTPTPDKQVQYVKNMKGTVYTWLKPYVDEMMEQEYNRYLDTIYTYFLNMEKSLNETYTIELIDPEHEYFTASPFSSHPIALSCGASGEALFTESWFIAKTCTLSFTAYAWSKFDCPSTLKILGSKQSVWDFKKVFLKKDLDLKPGLNTVILTLPEEEGTIVGTWQHEQSDGYFNKDTYNEDGTGVMGMMNANGVLFYHLDITYEIDGDVLHVIMKGETKDIESYFTIVSLTSDEMILRGQISGKETTYTRVYE